MTAVLVLQLMLRGATVRDRLPRAGIRRWWPERWGDPLMSSTTRRQGRASVSTRPTSLSPSQFGQLAVRPPSDGIVAFAGELDAAHRPAPRAVPRAQNLDRPGLDLGAVTFMDTSGFETLQRVQQRCRVNGWSFTIERSSPAVDRILQLIGVGHDLVDHQTADEPVRPRAR